MEAQISPVLEMTLLELFEALHISAAVVPTAVIATLVAIHLLQRRRQNLIDSARLVLELDRGLRSDDFRAVAVRIRDGNIKPTDPADELLLLRYINYVAPICKMHYDGLISKSDMESSYEDVIVSLYEYDDVRTYMRENKKSWPYIHRYMLAIVKS